MMLTYTNFLDRMRVRCEEINVVTVKNNDVGLLTRKKTNRRRPFSTMLINEMPLDVIRLRASDLANNSTGDEFKAAILLWCAAWHQTPPGTLPDDDGVLARMVGVHILKWRNIKAMALHGFAKRKDARLEHPLIIAYADREEREHIRRRAVSQRASKNNEKLKNRMQRAYDLVKQMGVDVDAIDISQKS